MTTKLIRLGAVVTLSAVLTAWIALTIAGGRPGSRYELVATFDDVAGMREGDAVKLAGIAVGEVSDIEVVQGRAQVTMAVDQEVRIPTDSTAKVRWRDLIGRRFVALEPGDAGTMLADGDRVERAASVVDLGQLVNQLVPLARSVSPEKVNEILTALLEAFEGNDAVFDELLADLRDVLAVLAERDETIDQLLADYDTIAGAVASRDAQIGQMVDNLVAISETFAGHEELLDRALVELASFTGNLDDMLSRGAADFGASIDELAALIGLFADDVATLESGFQGLPHTFTEMHSASNRGEWLRVSVLCLTVQPGPCPLPTSVGGDDTLIFDPGSVLGGLLEELGL